MTDIAGERHLGDGDAAPAVRHIVDGRHQALVDQLRGPTRPRGCSVGKIDLRRRAFAAPMTDFEPQGLADIRLAS